jgi:hypothetical protein
VLRAVGKATARVSTRCSDDPRIVTGAVATARGSSARSNEGSGAWRSACFTQHGARRTLSSSMRSQHGHAQGATLAAPIGHAWDAVGASETINATTAQSSSRSDAAHEFAPVPPERITPIVAPCAPADKPGGATFLTKNPGDRLALASQTLEDHLHSRYCCNPIAH